MLKYLAVTTATFLAAAFAVGCSHGQCSMGSNGKPLEGNPGATTNQASGYDASDPNHYHPQTDDTKQYRPADPNAVQPSNTP